MVRPLQFKGEKRSRKRKAVHDADKKTLTDDEFNSLLATELTNPAKDDDSWVTAEAPSDITGPIIFALPATQPSCIACDSNGKVFASAIENIVEGNTATAEPHDMRQVWVASKVPGTEQMSFKGHQGRNGILSASQEAISPEESFLCIATSDSAGFFSVQTEREKFFIITENTKGLEIRGDAESISFNTTFRIRMQARFKPRLKANKEAKAREKISRKELEEVVGRKLEDGEVRRLKKSRVQGDYHEAILDVRVKDKHDKYS